MSKASRERFVVAGALMIVAAVFCTGINWGLPSRRVDPFLFGDHPVWTGEQIMQLAGDHTDANLGADVDRDPIARSDAPVIINQTDAQRAQIVRRYRLFTYQPDEMITLMALAGMKPSARRLDPKLYQYGGMWIYPIGALIKLLARPQPGAAYYLDHPEEFARFYLIARGYCVAWGLIGALAVYWIARRASASVSVGVGAMFCFALMPVVINAAHEAKPHLPGAALILLAVICATRYVETGLKRWWVLAAVASGAAVGMVLSCAPCLVILPIMLLLRRESWNQRLLLLCSTVIIATDVYFLTNPYVLIHLLGDRAVLLSNLGNSQAMYQVPVSVGGLLNAVRLICFGATPLLGVLGVGAMILEARVKKSIQPMAWILGAVSMLILLQFALLATGKPAEYARFALLPDVALMIVAVNGIARLSRASSALLLVVVLMIGLYGFSYDWHFARDSISRSTRLITAERMRKLSQEGATTLAIAAEPAPYSLPPVDLFKWKLVLLPPGQTTSAAADVSLRTVDVIPPTAAEGGDFWTRPRLFQTPISWAAKPFEVTVRQKPAK